MNKLEMKCKNCIFWYPTLYKEFGPIGESRYTSVQEINNHFKKERARYFKDETIIRTSENYGECSCPNMRACNNSENEFFDTDNLCLFSDAGECPELRTGKEFGCINWKEKE